MTVQRDDPLTQIRIHAHLYGRSHAGRVAAAVLEALRPHVPDTLFRELVTQLPPGVVTTPLLVAARPSDLVDDIAGRLHVGRPDAAFYARVTFEQLNEFCIGVTPAALADAAPAALRPLLTARAGDPGERHLRRLRRTGSTGTLGLRRPEPERDLDATHRTRTVTA